jgi:hypothetical protein
MFRLRCLLPGLCLGLAGCMSPQPSTGIPGAALTQGVQVIRSLPENLPAKASPFPHSQFVLIATENFVEMLSPVPFVADLATDALHHNRAAQFEARYRDVHPYHVAVTALTGSPLIGGAGAELSLRPFVFLQDCTDDRYRLALVFDVTGPGWNGRYLYHCPTTYADDEMARPTPDTIASINRELTRGAALLRGLLERDARGQLPLTGRKAEVGSLHLVGHGSSGLLSPNLVVCRDADIVEEDAVHLVLRMKGDPGLAASAGGLFFGVHWFQPDQLHTLKRK